jgi:GPH family glycoside/pentoside/hexuronide:cation symporter/oligogalacturonide transporter
MFTFAAGDIFGGGGQSVISVLYLIYLTNVMQISPAWAGTAVLISKAWDAVNDPLMGYLSDNARTKFGRRRPFLIAGGFLIIAAIALLWLPVNFTSQTAKVAYVLASYLFYCTVSTIIAVPYSSMSTEITADFNECNKVNVLRLTFSLISTGLCTLLPSMLFGQYTKGNLSYQTFYLILVFGFGLLFAVPMILAGFMTRERVAYEDKRVPLSVNTVVKPLKVRAFRKLLGMYLCQAVTLDMVSAVILYYALYVVAGLDSTVFLGTFLGVQLLMFPIINHLVGRVGKTKIYRFGLPLAIIGSCLIAFYPSSLPVWGVYACTFLTALGFAGAQNMSWIIFPDVVDIGEMGLRERNTGSFSGVMTFVRTISSAIAVFLIGVALSLAGYIAPPEAVEAVAAPTQPEAVLLIIRLFVFLPFGLLMGYAFFLARGLRLTPEVSLRVKHFNAKLQAGEIETLDDDERKEYEELMREFVS